MSEPANTVVDEIENHRFLYRENDADAQLTYQTKGKQLILVHTEVPEALGGRGVGGRLVRAAVERAAASGETVLPWCPYARKWLRDHPDDAARITIDWNTSSA